MRKEHNAAFTLIELMVAVTIMAILVAIVSAVFHQSSVAWNSGTERMHANVTARAVLNFMAHELRHAVANDEFGIWVDTRDPRMGESGATHIYFWTFSGMLHSTNRMARHVRYSMGTGDDEDKIMREEWTVDQDSDYLSAITNLPDEAEEEFAVARNVKEVLFRGWPELSGGGHFGRETNLPRGVYIRLVLAREDDISNVAAWSAGPDGRTNPDDPDDPVNEDNIGSW